MLTTSNKMLDNIIKQILDSRDKSNFGIKDKIFFFRELSYLLGGGISIIQAVQIINESTDNYALKEISASIRESLNAGKSFSFGILRLPRYFNHGDASMIQAGEQSGNLIPVLSTLAQEYGYLTGIQNKFIGAMLYPIILLVISVFAVVMLFIYILPGIFEILEQFENVEIPWTTALLKNFSTFLVSYGTRLGGGALLIGLIITIILSSEQGQKYFFNFLFELPVVGKMSKYFFLIKFSRYLKMMLNSGMGYVDLFVLLKNIVGIPPYQEMLDNVITGIGKGERIYDSMLPYVGMIPMNALMLIKVGEESANLSSSLDTIILMYEEELNNDLTNLSKVIEPVLIVVVGGVITVIALSVFGIIGNILQSVQTL